MKCLGTTPPAH
ncbi:unnamed protein product [Linum tenue]|uniref:Uncharacterized protein n=1 Tax=Linum tenue TaxID=586396 RepID=A0AAV0REJ3_9ROSI|nr:unnamed protein product [Linum tenue]